MIHVSDGHREATQQDIATLRQRVQQMEQTIETLQEQVAHYRHYFDIAPMGIATTSPDSSWIEFNHALCEMFGYTPEELLCTTWADLTHPDDLAEDATLLEQLLAGEMTSSTRNKRFIRKNGSIFHGTVYTQGVYRSDGSFHHVVSILYDTTPHVHAEAEVRRLTLELQHYTNHSHQRSPLLQEIIDHSPAVIYVKDRDGRYLVVNRTWSEVLNIEAAFAIGKTDDQIFPLDISEGFQVNDQHVVASGTSLQIEEYAPHADGLHTYISIKFPLFDETGIVTAIGGISTDITERKRIEERIQHLAALVDNSSEFIGMATLDGHPIYLNEAGRDLVGLDEEEVQQHQVIDYFPPAEQERVHRDVLPIVIEQGNWSSEMLLRHFKTGADIPVNWSTFLVMHPDTGNPTAMATMARDLTEQKRAENELRIFKMLVDNAPDGVAIGDLAANVIYANDAYGSLTGYSETIVGMNFLDCFDETGRAEALQMVELTTKYGCWQSILTFCHKDGGHIQVHTTGFLVYDVWGQPMALMGLFRDLTEQQRQEQERAALQQQIIEIQQATISELSTPLLPLARDIVAMPLVGTLDTARAQQVMETLLEGIAHHHASIAILDITGIKVVDTQVAQALIDTAQAVRLLGTQVILTGIQPQIAQTLVHLGVDLQGIVTQSTLQAGIAYALNRRSET